MVGTSILSVVIPVYNREGKIKHAVESVMNQTCDNWELIIVDDCSTDRSFDVISSLDDSRIRVFQMSKNSGAAAARNFGIQQCRGIYISFLDSDDAYENDFVDLTLAKWKTVDDTIGLLWTGCVYHRSKLGKIMDIPALWQPGMDKNPYYTFLKDLKIGTNTGISIKRSVFDKVGLFDDQLPAAEDTDLFLRIAQHYSFDYVPNYLIHINQTEGDRLSLRFDKIAIAYNKILPKHINEIQQHKRLRLKFFYKLMWLNYHLGNRSLARKYFGLVLADRVMHRNAWFIFSLFELLGTKAGARIHIKLSHLQH